MLIRMLTFPALLLAFACTSPGTTVPPKSTEPFVPKLALRPVAVSLGRGATQGFQAEINYPEGARYIRQPVVWRVLEAEGGPITAAGLYTTPAAAGIYHLEVKREDFPGVTATATVTVK